MSEWHEVAHFLYGRGFWYAHPLREIDGLTEEQLFWTPSPNSLCALWQVGHIAHREGEHIARIIQGVRGPIRPAEYEVFGTDWCSTEDVRHSVGPVDQVLAWVGEVRDESQEYIASLPEEDFHKPTPGADRERSIADWLFITVAHTALHVGRIQLLRALIEDDYERPC